MTAPAIGAKVYRLPDLTTPVTGGTLTAAVNRRWQDKITDAGSGQLSIPNDHADRAVIHADDIVCFNLDGTDAFSFVVTDDESATVSATSEADQLTTFSGPGLLGLLSESIVYPSRGADVRPIQEERLFSWPSVEYDDSGWGTASSVCSIVTAFTDWPILPFADGFPDLTADVIGPSGATTTTATVGDWYLRKTLTIATDGLYTIYSATDNTGTVYVDGQSVLDIQTEQGYLKAVFVNVELSAGAHTFATVVHNIPGGTDNPTGIVLAIYLGEADQVGSTLIAHADTTWKILAYPGTPPGMSPRQAAAIVLAEAQARGELTGWTLTGTTSHDSASSTWSYVGDISTKVGTDLRTFIVDELGSAYCDVRVPARALRLDLYNRGAYGAASGVTLNSPTDSTNPMSGELMELMHKRRSVTATRALVRWQGGWHVIDATPGGARPKTIRLDLGAIRSLDEVARIAGIELGIHKNIRTAVTVGWAPTTSAEPYVDVHVGDTVTVPDRDGSPVTEQVLGFTVSEDTDGQVTFAAEIADVIAEQGDRFEQAIKKFADGSMRGTVGAAQPAPTLTPALGIPPKPTEVPFSLPGPVTTSTSPPWGGRKTLILRRFRCYLGTAGSSTTTVLLKVDGSTVSTVNLASTVTHNDDTFTHVVAATSVLTVEVSAAGTGAADLTCVAEYVPG